METHQSTGEEVIILSTSSEEEEEEESKYEYKPSPTKLEAVQRALRSIQFTGTTSLAQSWAKEALPRYTVSGTGRPI